MNKIVFAFLLLTPFVSSGQFNLLDGKEPSDEPDVVYYKFYDGIQMIELDYLTAYHREVNYLEQAQPRALEWGMVLGGPKPNVYLFRSINGEIVKQFGELEKTKLLSVEKSEKVARMHNTLFAHLGSSLGFSSISTKYFPYYLIGRSRQIGQSEIGLIDSLGNVVLPQEYDVIWGQENLFITRKGDTNELRDAKLNLRFSSNELLLQPAQRNRGFVDVIQNNKKGLMNSMGEIIVPCNYDFIIDRFNKNGLAKVRKGLFYGFVNKKGKEIIECKYRSVGNFSEGLLNVRRNDKWGFINADGKTIIKHKYDLPGHFVDGLARVAVTEGFDKWCFGFIDKEGNEAIPLSYSNARDFRNGVAEVMLNGRWIKIDKTGGEIKWFNR